jgi:hypothetical protein
MASPAAPTHSPPSAGLARSPRTSGTSSPTWAPSSASEGSSPSPDSPASSTRLASVFAEKLAAEGFTFLDARVRDGGTGPALTVQRDGAVVGAIGPVEKVGMCGAAPIPVSSGRTDRHRLHRGGDRQANSALWRIVLVRMGCHQPTKDYVARRTAEGKTKAEIMRCLKRYIAREVFPHLLATTPPEHRMAGSRQESQPVSA